jgi:hypothetical protein
MPKKWTKLCLKVESVAMNFGKLKILYKSP